MQPLQALKLCACLLSCRDICKQLIFFSHSTLSYCGIQEHFKQGGNWLAYCNNILEANYRNTAEKTSYDHPVKNAIKVWASDATQGETVH